MIDKQFLQKLNDAYKTKIPYMETNPAVKLLFSIYEKDKMPGWVAKRYESGVLPTLKEIDGKVVLFAKDLYKESEHRPKIIRDEFTKEDLKAYRQAQKEQGLYKEPIIEKE